MILQNTPKSEKGLVKVLELTTQDSWVTSLECIK